MVDGLGVTVLYSAVELKMVRVMASDIKAVEVMLRRDKEARLSASELIVELAKKIGEKPEDLVWFFEMKRRMREVEEKANRISDKELEEWEKAIEKELASSKPVRRSLGGLMQLGNMSLRKFRRIEAKLKKLGVI